MVLIKLGDKAFDFRRPARDFPKKLTLAFLLVDLLNNLNELADDNLEALKAKIKNKPPDELLQQAAGCIKKYSKVATKKFFAELA